MTFDGYYVIDAAASTVIPTAAQAQALRWPASPGATDTITTDLGWDANPIAHCPPEAVDLLRIAGSAYLADRLTRRGTGFTRELGITVALRDASRWTTGRTEALCDLLRWLTGDNWTIEFVADTTPIPSVSTDPRPAIPPHGVALLSGGLDSYLGALHLLDNPDANTGSSSDDQVVFVGHKDSANAVRHAQTAVERFLATAVTPPPSYSRYAFRQTVRPPDSSSRSRSLLFVALGLASAAATGATRLIIPENGYTSLNLPLHPNRGGALSTRSTHPLTFFRINELLTELQIPVAIENPFAACTKGEAMRHVSNEKPPDGWLATAGHTLSCSKLDGANLRAGGGNANLHCGLCVPCLVRRGTFIAADQTDHTVYLINELTGAARDELISRRQDDIDAVLYATAEPLDENLIDSGSWPPGYDLDAAADLAQRGLDELAAVPLP